VLWQASGRIGAHRLHPFVGELLDRLTLYGELTLTPALDKQLRQASRPPARPPARPRARALPAPRDHHHPARHLAQAADPQRPND